MVIEWAERAGALLPREHLWISIAFGRGENDRDLHLTAHGAQFESIMTRLEQAWTLFGRAGVDGERR